MSLRPTAPVVTTRAAGTPSPEVTGQFAEFPGPGSPEPPWASHPGTPVSVLGTVVGARSPPPFHGPRESGGPGSRPGYSRLQPVLAITALPGLQRLSGVFPRPPYPERRRWGLRCREAYPHGTGILTRFPFGGYQLGPALGPANPWLIVVAMEPLSFPAEGVPTPLRCYYHRDLHRPRVHRTSRPDFRPMAAPPYPTRTNGPRAGVSAAGLSP